MKGKRYTGRVRNTHGEYKIHFDGKRYKGNGLDTKGIVKKHAE